MRPLRNSSGICRSSCLFAGDVTAKELGFGPVIEHQEPITSCPVSVRIQALGTCVASREVTYC